MPKFLKTIIISLSMFLTVGFLGAAGQAWAVGTGSQLINNSSVNAACSGIALQQNASCSSSGSSVLEKTVKTALEILSIVVGIISVIMIIVGGIKFALSQGDSTQTNSAKNTIIFAIVGLVIVAAAQLIVKFVVNKLNF